MRLFLMSLVAQAIKYRFCDKETLGYIFEAIYCFGRPWHHENVRYNNNNLWYWWYNSKGELCSFVENKYGLSIPSLRMSLKNDPNICLACFSKKLGRFLEVNWVYWIFRSAAPNLVKSPETNASLFWIAYLFLAQWCEGSGRRLTFSPATMAAIVRLCGRARYADLFEQTI